MNRDQLEGKWDALKGRIQRAYAELTEDEFKAAEGDVDKLFGTIQARFGDTKEKIKEKLDQLGR